ncbi:DUF218 domain-containing protein [Mucilaginibacter pineti]|uniref:DUF218 domain-containing protein n=1 Tax=Mucilaginibacter pineti TaxID=1391627 RepID=A0A1G7LR61_9SPHI|nr:YdcF family protein [Mucilaginibacter pineti]SDF51997.1 DUF218 domain-containing protein [Mucilaginibacter pineti]
MDARKYFVALLVVFCRLCAGAQPQVGYQPIGKNFVQAKNYYLLTLLQNYKPASVLIAHDPVLIKLTKTKLAAIQNTLTTCNDVACYTNAIKFNPDEIKAAAERLTALYADDNALGTLVKKHLIPSGAYGEYENLTPAMLLAKAFEQDATAVNYTIDVYAGGRKPNYPAVDSISFNVRDAGYIKVIHDGAVGLTTDKDNSKLFFLPAMNYALHCLQINGRNDAANDEPMTLKANKEAYKRIKNTNWNKYKYTLILVPGEGPELPGVAISAGSIARCRGAAAKCKEGMAPFIMVSGGKVHPYKTPYCEADEMKRFMIDSLHVPADVILVDPHARHTTTNLRNCARLIFRYGIPVAKPFITSTDKSQSTYISGMADRCLQELHYVPYTLGKRLSPTEQEFYPLAASLQINPVEPLDP